MYIALAAISVFIVGFLIINYFFPGKTEKDLLIEPDEEIYFQTEKLQITRYPAIGPTVTAYPGAKLTISNKRIIISQKALGGRSFVVRELMLNEKRPEQQYFTQKNWGNVLVSTVNYQSCFSVEGDLLVLKNPNAVNLNRYEIKGLPNPKMVLEIVQQEI